MDFKKVTFLKVYTGEDVIVEDMPLFKAVIKEAMRLKLAAARLRAALAAMLRLSAVSIIKSVRSLRGCPICR